MSANRAREIAGTHSRVASVRAARHLAVSTAAAGARPPLLGLLLVSLLVGCANYQIGNRTLYRTDIHTVHVPIFYSNSKRPYLGQWLTEAVVKEIELRTPYKVVHDPLADSILTGRITNDIKRVESENKNDEPRRLLFEPTVTVTWIDRQGQILMNRVFELSADMVPEAGQSITSAQMKTFQLVAQQIVSEMEANNW